MLVLNPDVVETYWDHLVHSDDHAEVEDWLDRCTRWVFNLLTAAHAASTRKIVLLSTLDLFLDYSPHFCPTTTWMPRPSTEPHQLGHHLVEFICREFAPSTNLEVVVVRLRRLDATEQRFWVDSAAVREALLVIVTEARTMPDQPAVGRATDRDQSSYNIVHLQGASCAVPKVGAEDGAAPSDTEILALVDGRTAAGANVTAVDAETRLESCLLLGSNGMMGSLPARSSSRRG